jgi:hypothetical protein
MVSPEFPIPGIHNSRNRCQCNVGSGVNLDKCLVQDLFLEKKS